MSFVSLLNNNTFTGDINASSLNIDGSLDLTRAEITGLVDNSTVELITNPTNGVKKNILQVKDAGITNIKIVSMDSNKLTGNIYISGGKINFLLPLNMDEFEINNTADIIPKSDELYRLGSLLKKWANIYSKDGYFTGSISCPIIDYSLGVKILYNGSTVLETTLSGLTITGNTLQTGNITLTGYINPMLDISQNLGSNVTRWLTIYAKNIDSSDGVDIKYNNNTKLSTTNTGITVTGLISLTGDLIPFISNGQDIGQNLLRWRNIYAYNCYLSTLLSCPIITNCTSITQPSGTITIGTTTTGTSIMLNHGDANGDCVRLSQTLALKKLVLYDGVDPTDIAKFVGFGSATDALGGTGMQYQIDVNSWHSFQHATGTNTRIVGFRMGNVENQARLPLNMFANLLCETDNTYNIGTVTKGFAAVYTRLVSQPNATTLVIGNTDTTSKVQIARNNDVNTPNLDVSGGINATKQKVLVIVDFNTSSNTRFFGWGGLSSGFFHNSSLGSHLFGSADPANPNTAIITNMEVSATTISAYRALVTYNTVSPSADISIDVGTNAARYNNLYVKNINSSNGLNLQYNASTKLATLTDGNQSSGTMYCDQSAAGTNALVIRGTMDTGGGYSQYGVGFRLRYSGQLVDPTNRVLTICNSDNGLTTDSGIIISPSYNGESYLQAGQIGVNNVNTPLNLVGNPLSLRHNNFASTATKLVTTTTGVSIGSNPSLPTSGAVCNIYNTVLNTPNIVMSGLAGSNNTRTDGMAFSLIENTTNNVQIMLRDSGQTRNSTNIGCVISPQPSSFIIAGRSSDNTIGKLLQFQGSGVELYDFNATAVRLSTNSLGLITAPGSTTNCTNGACLNAWNPSRYRPSVAFTGVASYDGVTNSEGPAWAVRYHTSTNSQLSLIRTSDLSASGAPSLTFAIRTGNTVLSRSGSIDVFSSAGRGGENLTEPNSKYICLIHPVAICSTFDTPIMYTTTAGNIQFASGKILDMNGGQVQNSVTKTKVTSITSTPYSVLETDYMLAVTTSSGSKVLNLPQISTLTQGIGTTYIIKNVSNSYNTIKINRASTDLIDGQTQITLNAPYNSITLICTAAGVWSVI